MIPPSDLLKELLRTSPFQPATNYWRAIELDAVQRHGMPSGRGLDLGCGDGKLTMIIDRATDGSRQWVGIDPDPAETALAADTGLYQAVHTASATSIPEADASFDFVFSNSVLEHIPPLEDVLAEASRVLRPGGRFIATVPANPFHDLLAGPLLGADREAYLKEIDARCAHLRYWSQDDWKAHLGAHHLQLTAAVGYLSGRQLRH